MALKPIIIGTAGHIDHGKTALVKALTGIDADRLEEEKRRGITIDLGFAHMELEAEGRPLRLGFVDVPGHEKFVRNMLAGVGGIDLVLLVVSAGEGIMPQTREHFDICRLLQVRRGITVLTKADTVDEETLSVVRLEVEDFVRGSFLDVSQSPLVAVSAKTGSGIDELKRTIARVATESEAKDTKAIFRLPIDRVFTMKGFGSVVTGTLVAGSVARDDEVEVFPTGTRVRVRGVEVHGSAAERAQAGERTALNLAGIAKEELVRGMTLSTPGMFRTTRRVDASISLLPGARPLRNRARVHFHVHTAEAVAEVVLHGVGQLSPGGTAFAQLRLPAPMLLLPGDRFILRQFSPVVTIGGGEVLDNSPPVKKSAPEVQRRFLETLQNASKAESFFARIHRRQQDGLPLAAAVTETGWSAAALDSIATDLLQAGRLLRLGDVFVAAEHFAAGQEALSAAVKHFHAVNPLVAGIGREELREKLRMRPEVFTAALDRLAAAGGLEVSGEHVRAAGRVIVMKDEETEAKRTIEFAFLAAGLKVPALKDVLAALPLDKARAQKIVTLLLREHILVKLSDDLVFHRNALAALRQALANYKATSEQKTIDVARFKDLAGVSRKYAIPLLEFLDRERVTRREGDVRVIL